MSKNIAKVIDIVVTDDSMAWDFNEAAVKRFGAAKGLRHCIGAAYLIATKDERETFIGFMGQGAIRRGLLVLAKGRHTSEEDAKAATELAESLRKVVATKPAKPATKTVAKAAPAKKATKCSVCGEAGHNARTCPVKAAA